MRTIILSIVTFFIYFSISAQVKTQGLTTSSSHIDSVNVMWNANKLARVSPLVITLDLTDSMFFSYEPPISKLPITKLLETENDTIGDIIFYSWDLKEKALKLNFDYTNHSGINNTSVGFDWSYHKINSNSWNPFIESDIVKGVFLDLTDPWSRFLTLTYKADGLDDSAYIRVDLTDANGRQSNLRSPRKKIYKDSIYHDTTDSLKEIE